MSVVAVLAALVFAPSALAGTYTWAQPASFTSAAPGSNPDHDSYSRTPWAYQETATTTVGSALSNLPTFQSGIDGGLTGWTDPKDANVVVATPGSAPVSSNGATFTTGNVAMSAASDKDAALTWTSPFSQTTSVTFTGTVTAADGSCFLATPAWSLVQGTTTLASNQTASGGSYSQTVSVPAGGKVSLEVGYSATLSVFYSAACASENATMTATASSSTAPSVTLTSPSQGALYQGFQPTFAGTASTGFGAASTVSILIYSGTTVTGTPVETVQTPVGSGGAFSVLPSGAQTLANGTYSAVAEQSDLSSPPDVGKSGFVAFTVAAAPGGGGGGPVGPTGTSGTTGTSGATGTSGPGGTFAPPGVTVTLNAPSTGALTTATPTFTGTAGAASAGATLNLLVYAGTTTTSTLEHLQTGTIASDGSFSIALAPSQALSDGFYTVVASVNTTAGTVFSSPVLILIKVNAPALELIGPVTGANSGRQPVIYGLAGNEVGDDATVTVALYSGGTATGTPVGSSTVTRSGTSWIEVWPTSLKLGLYTADATQSDVAGHTTTSKPTTFLVVPTPATIGSTIAITQNGTSSVPIYCPAGVGMKCTGTVTIVTVRKIRLPGKRKAAVQTLLSSHVSFYGTTTFVARGHTSGAQQRAFKHSRSVAVRVTAKLSIAGEPSKTFTRSGRASIAH